MNISEIHPAFLGFFEKTIMPQIPNQLAQWSTFFFLFAAGGAFNAELNKYLPAMIAVGVADNNGNIDLDKIESFAEETFKKVPEIKIGEIGLDATDFKNFIAFCKQNQIHASQPAPQQQTFTQ